MFSKRVPLLLAVLAAALVYELCPDAAAQNLPKNSSLHTNSAAHVPTSFPIKRFVSTRPITPGEKALAAALKNAKTRRMTSGLPTSSTQIFKAAITTPSGGQETYAGATGDLNGDGKLDVVLASQCATNNCSNGVVTVLLGNGDGTYQAPVTYSVGEEAEAVALSDVNGDGKLDILATSYCNSDCSSGAVNVLLGNGDGTFQPAVAYNTGAPASVALSVGDVNGDGKLDLLVADDCSSSSSCSNGVLSVLLGNGDGTFQTAVNYGSGGESPQGIAIADVNGDGKLDVAIANECASNSDCSSGFVSVLLGNGDGTFQNAVNVGSGGVYADSVAIGDVNGDGHADLVVANRCNNSSNCTNGTVGVMLGNGDGTFQSALSYASGGLFAQSLALVDLNADGKTDVVVSNQCQSNSGCQYGNSTSVLLGNGDGTFQLSASYASGSNDFDEMDGPSITKVMVGDVNGDGLPDILLTNSCDGSSFICGSGSVSVFLGYGDGTLQAGVIYTSAGWDAYGLATADVNGDGKPDILVANECASNTNCNNGAMSVMLNNGDGTFQAGSTFPSGGSDTLWLATGDLNGDGKADVVLTNQCASNTNCSQGSVSVLLGNGDGTFQAPVTYATSNDGVSVALADVNGDGNLDIVLAAECSDGSCTGGAVNVLLGNGDGTFQDAISYSSGGLWTLGVAVADVNGDGKPDVIVASECLSNNSCSNGVVSVLLGNGDGTFQPAVTYNSGGNDAMSVQVADMNGDGKADIVVDNECSADCSTGAISVLLGNGDGTFQPAIAASIPQSEMWQSIVVGDFNGDHKLDVAAGGSNALLVGNGDGTFQPAMSLGASGFDTVMADFNGDGRPDLAVGGVTVLLNISNGFLVSTTTAVSSSSNPSSFGQSVTFTATVTPQSAGTPTGTVTFSDGSTQLGQSTVSDGAATLSTSALAIGSHSITASYSGDSTYAASVSTGLAQVVATASTTTALTGTPNPANVGQSVTLTATVTPTTSGTPTGTVNFFDGSTQIGNSSLNDGVATFSTSTLAAGSHSVTAVYSGDDNYNGSTSSAVNEVVATPGFALSSTSLTPTTIQAGGSAQWTITINPQGGFDPSTVSLSCGVTPVASVPVTCTVGSVTVSGGVGSAMLQVGSTAPHAAALHHVAQRESGPGKGFLLALLLTGLCLGSGSSKSNRRKLLGFSIALLIAGCMLQTACGGSSSSTMVPGTPQGAYTVTVTGSAGGMQQTTSVVVTVQ
ncbi:MAG TPA: FG-GAP-like repeat-containing protein [Verrucomicrobiae bacterium]|nr:FG-GAP-like repeat-containing protein [Verrucomicrobiae bacterium]